MNSTATDNGQHGIRKPLPSQETIKDLPRDGGEEFNRLIFETSPYLLQHARNPVDWYPWGEEAFEKAKKESKPIFLSVGYSSCHWCHVMEHESFENEEVAAYLKENFVSVKVDREERPDLDEIYMSATQIMTRRGGWPNSVWLTADGRPWFAGTYFPREHFINLLKGLTEAWSTRRDEINLQADKLSEAIHNSTGGLVNDDDVALTRDVVDTAIRAAENSFDINYGGFGGAPKFPPHNRLRLMLYENGRASSYQLETMLKKTLDEMAFGGIHDHVGGGFHRYATDDHWFLPHFEKMLYDNAQLAWTYAEAYAQFKTPRYREVAEGTLDWVLRQMTDSAGGFYSALDADSEGEEGKYYLWTRDELLETLGASDGQLLAKVYQASKAGNYREEASGKRTGQNILFLSGSLEESAKTALVDADPFKTSLHTMRDKLLHVRDSRIPPQLDDKVLTSWNGLMIGAFAHAGKTLEKKEYILAAQKAANFILSDMKDGDRLYRTYRNGEARLKAYLDDYAFLADGLIELFLATGEDQWLDEAGALADTMLRFYEDGEKGGFFFTAHDHEELLARSKDPLDRAIPGGNSVAARVFSRLGQLQSNAAYLTVANRTLKTFMVYAQKAPSASETLIQAIAEHLAALDEGLVTDSGVRIYNRPVRIDINQAAISLSEDRVAEVELEFLIDDGWHINSHAPIQDYLIRTEIVLPEDSPYMLKDVKYPKGRKVLLGAFPESVSIYDQLFTIKAKVRLKEDAEAAPLKLSVKTQACDDKTCLAPEVNSISIPVTLQESGEAESPQTPRRAR